MIAFGCVGARIQPTRLHMAHTPHSHECQGVGLLAVLPALDADVRHLGQCVAQRGEGEQAARLEDAGEYLGGCVWKWKRTVGQIELTQRYIHRERKSGDKTEIVFAEQRNVVEKIRTGNTQKHS